MASAHDKLTEVDNAHIATGADHHSGLLTPADVEAAEQAGNPIYKIIRADEFGFEAEVSNAKILRNENHLSIVDANGEESLIINSKVFLKDGSSVAVDFDVVGNHISGSYANKVPMDQVVASPGTSTRGAAACVSSSFLAIAAVAGGAAGIISAPVTGPAGPLATVAAMTGIAGSVGMIATSCSGN